MNYRVFDAHTHFSIETSAIPGDAEKIGYTVENKTIEEHLAMMDRVGITFSLLSCPTLRDLDDPEKCLKYIESVNNTGAQICDDNPLRFGFAASLPLPYVDLAVKEAYRAVTKLGANAILMCSNYSGMYLGNPEFEPIFDAIDHLGIPIILHPTAPQQYPPEPITGKILPMFEFVADSTRTMLDLFAAETLNRHPNVRIVVPHAGSFVPAIYDRYLGIMRGTKAESGLNVPMHQLYFDLACDSFPRGAKALMELTDTKHILYGSDYPAIPEQVIKDHLRSAAECEAFGGKQEDVLWKNSLYLFLKAVFLQD